MNIFMFTSWHWERLLLLNISIESDKNVNEAGEIYVDALWKQWHFAAWPISENRKSDYIYIEESTG
jgi:hypothetical protein